MGDADRFQIVRPLGPDAAAFVARDTSITPPRPVVLERVTRSSPGDDERKRLVRRARALLGFEHPKVVPLREVIERDGEVLVVSDFTDGEWLSAVLGLDPRPPLEIPLRLLLDVLEGLAALHALKDDKGQLLHFVHGALSPDSVLVADDGVAEIARPCSVGVPRTERFIAPEVRRGELATDVRADIYSVGAMLREVLASAPPEAKWAEQLTDIAWRACSVDPDNRWPSAAAMATTLRRVGGSRLASADDIASYVRRNFGVRMRARRAALDILDEGPPSSEPMSVRPADLLDDSSAPTIVDGTRPANAGKAVAKVALVKKPVERAELEAERGSPPPRPATDRGISAIAPPMSWSEPAAPGKGEPKAPLPPPDIVVQPAGPAGKVSLPPPDILVEVPKPEKKTSLPPPDIVVPELATRPSTPARARSSSPPGSDSYRRQLPTFPTFEPPRRSPWVSAMAVAAGMVTTFGLGWWLGSTHPPPGAVPAAVCPPAATVVLTAPSPPASTVAAALVSPTPPPASANSAPGSGASSSSVAPSAPGAKPPPLWTPPANKTPGPPPPVLTTAPAPPPPVAPPRPSGSAGYVPSEL